jgi:hypothetical protein
MNILRLIGQNALLAKTRHKISRRRIKTSDAGNHVQGWAHDQTRELGLGAQYQ